MTLTPIFKPKTLTFMQNIIERQQKAVKRVKALMLKEHSISYILTLTGQAYTTLMDLKSSLKNFKEAEKCYLKTLKLSDQEDYHFCANQLENAILCANEFCDEYEAKIPKYSKPKTNLYKKYVRTCRELQNF